MIRAGESISIFCAPSLSHAGARQFVFLLALLSNLSAFGFTGADVQPPSPSSNLYVSRYKVVLNQPPAHVPTNWNTDGPMLGNGDLGVVIGGAPEEQQFWFSKCDFWRAKPLYPWFTPALIGHLNVRIPALKGASYHTEQFLDRAEVDQTFSTTQTTVKIRSWTPATTNALIVEISCTGQPVGVDLAPGTLAGYGATVETGRDGDLQWLTRSFAGSEMDWPNRATLAVRSAGGICVPDRQPILPSASDKGPMEIGGAPGPSESGFIGRISDVEIFNQVLSDVDIATFDAKTRPPYQPGYKWDLNALPNSIFQDSPAGKAIAFPGKPVSHLVLYPGTGQNLSLLPVSLSAWLYVESFNNKGTNQVIRYGDPERGVSLILDNGELCFGSNEKFARTEEAVPLNKWIHVVGTSDGNTVQLYMDGVSIASYRVNVGLEHLTLTPSRPILIVCKVRTNHEAPDFQKEAIQDARNIDENRVSDLQKKHLAWWHRFWQESTVNIGDPLLERYYYGSFYILACCSRNVDFPPALFGNQASGDRPWMGGDYHLNYNYQAPWWGCYIANHIGLTDPYDTPILQFLDRGKLFARNYLRKKGVLYSVGIGPLGSSSDWTKPHNKWVDDSEDKHFFAGQKSNAAFCTSNMIMRWRMTYDLNYARKVYPFLLEVAIFWEDYLVYENGRYVDYHDSVQEGSGDDMNAIQSLGLIRGLFQTVLDMSNHLGIDQDRRAKWQDILAKLSGYSFQKVRDINRLDVSPEFLKNPANLDKTVFRYSEKGFPWSPDCTLGIQHIYPAGAFGLDSTPAILEIARDTVSALGRWSDDNHTMTLYPAAARVGYDPEILLGHLREQCENPQHGFPNLVLNYGGGGIETCSTVTATINEMLLQSHQDVLRVFADWPKNRDACFQTLRGYGAFLVSASIKDGVIGPVTITSEKGRDCRLVNPWPGRTVSLTHDHQQFDKLQGECLTFKTTTGETLSLKPD